ncbi:hypothetical protein HMN09_01368100 [Mycena chlorophos]|uniref:DUF6534 domain-containing protein n=1 Tax=Mycena chlorophos TaxID=658473 RepID=A0A8H6RUZ9_MYCCL|nr:hypothetical protein HMN09_01403200 [Mycena chlorophos]KAF7288857.1 hypothetical protein HMN09_01368100 [Mycena chlorophos]
MAPNPATIAHGPMLLGTIFNVMLMGVLIMQVYIYATTYKRDSKWIKWFIFVLTFADTMNTVFDIWYMYDCLILHFGDFEYLTSGNWIFATDPAMVAIVGAMTEGFYAWRIYALTKNVWITGLVVLCATCDFFGGMATAAAISYIPQFARFQQFEATVIVWIVGATTADLIIVGTLVFYLNTHRTGFASTDTKLDKLIRITIQTGMISFIFSVVHLSLYLGYSTGLHLLFNFPQSKLYSNSLMSTLNARGGWGQRTDNNTAGPGVDSRGNTIPLQVSVGVHSFSTPNTVGKSRVDTTRSDMIDMDRELGRNYKYEG